jgi:short-subunit dehydrogenase
VAGRIGRANAGAYSASKFALAGWTESLRLEEREHGVHVGLVLPGFIATEGFPQESLRNRPHTRWLVSTTDAAADAIVQAGPGGKAERYVPRPWALVPALRHGMPGIWRRIAGGVRG